jgi:hypothetical protein
MTRIVSYGRGRACIVEILFFDVNSVRSDTKRLTYAAVAVIV